jgi:hypothetical protein
VLGDWVQSAQHAELTVDQPAASGLTAEALDVMQQLDDRDGATRFAVATPPWSCGRAALARDPLITLCHSLNRTARDWSCEACSGPGERWGASRDCGRSVVLSTTEGSHL